MRRFFRVICKHGHHGHRRFQPICFVFCAENAVKAMDLAKAMPGVKHDKMILSCREISYAEYLNERKVSAYEKLGDL